VLLQRTNRYRTVDGDLVIHLVKIPRPNRYGLDDFPWYATLENKTTGRKYTNWYTIEGRWSQPKPRRKEGEPDRNRTGVDLVALT